MIYLLHYLIYPIISMMFVIGCMSAFQLLNINNKIMVFLHFLLTFIMLAVFSTFVMDDIRIVVAQSIEIFSLSLIILKGANLWQMK